jgi:uncharacterized protein YndB with AHSA1/START domain
MSTIHHQLRINAPVARVYEAIATADGISTWWDRQTAVPADRSLVLEHNPGPEHGVVKLRVVELVPNTRIEWECISTHPPSSPASAWTGTHFLFEMAESPVRGVREATRRLWTSVRPAMMTRANSPASTTSRGARRCRISSW